MKRWLCLASVALLTGCSAMQVHPVNSAAVGSVGGARELATIGMVIPDYLHVRAGEDGRTILRMNGGEALSAQVWLNEKGRGELVAALTKVQEWSDISRREGIEGFKRVANIFEPGQLQLDTPIVAKGVQVDFSAANQGQQTAAFVTLTDISYLGGKHEVQAIGIFNMEQTGRLLELLQAVPDHTEKAAVMAQKKDLLLR